MSLVEHFDVLIVGAGLSGIGAACHLQMKCPTKSYAIFEARASLGGTWDLFRYPGIRSDSDMFTLGYNFRPWREPQTIADGGSILKYVAETAREYGVDRKIRYRHRIVRAEWSSKESRWTVDVKREVEGDTIRVTCAFLYLCSGYYRYDEGHSPPFPGKELFGGTIVHPQHWPADLDYTGKRVVVVGSGATAVTIVPAMAERAAHVTMLQRSPGYIVSLPSRDPIAKALRRFLPDEKVYPIVRWKNVALTTLSYQLSRRRPAFMKKLIRRGIERALPADYDVDTHFSPRYEPWDQRLCVVPDGDLFKALSKGKASIVTDQLEGFTKTGLTLRSGAELPADIVVMATGLQLLAFGGIQLVVDGKTIDVGQTVAYKGLMLSGVPNLVYALGYTNASWTLKADLVSEYTCRLLQHMDRQGSRVAVPKAPDPSEPTQPFLDLASGYVQRSVAQFPKQGSRLPWRLFQSYPRDVVFFRRGGVDDGMEFRR